MRFWPDRTVANLTISLSFATCTLGKKQYSSSDNNQLSDCDPNDENPDDPPP
jgi:hypothetical protein